MKQNIILKLSIIALFLVKLSPVKAQQIKLDTLYESNKILKIESKRNNQKFGPTLNFLTYTEEPVLNSYQFYIDNQLCGFEIQLIEGRDVLWIKNYRKGTPIIKKKFLNNIPDTEEIFPSFKAKIKYDKFKNIKHIEYPELKEKVEFYPNYAVKSIILTDSSKNEISRKYYEFSENGVLKIEGTLADSFITVYDTIIIFVEEIDADIYQVIYEEIPLKHGDWFYYSSEGILQEEKSYKYFTRRKGKTIRK
jgi:hypothetical protein